MNFGSLNSSVSNCKDVALSRLYSKPKRRPSFGPELHSDIYIFVPHYQVWSRDKIKVDFCNDLTVYGAYSQSCAILDPISQLDRDDISGNSELLSWICCCCQL